VLPKVVYRVKSQVPKMVNLRHSGRFFLSGAEDEYPRDCITSNGLGRNYKYEKPGQADTLAGSKCYQRSSIE
jgi:hypothetical protein